MPWFPAVPPALAATDGARGINSKKRAAGLPRLLHKLFIKVLRLRPASAAAAEECCYYYGAGSASWAGVLSSIPEEDYDDDDDSSEEEEGTPEVVVVPGPAAAVLRKAKSQRFRVGPPDAAAVVHVEVLV